MATRGEDIPVKEWFTLGCRLFGMWQLLVAASYVISAFNIAAKFYPPGSSLAYSFGGYMVHVFAHFFLAAWLLKGAPKIADFFYPPSRSHEKTPERKAF
jgi:hypothetical protein